MKSTLFKFVKFSSILFLVLFLGIWLVDFWVKKSSTTQLYSSIDDLPKNKVGLLLGTKKMLRGGNLNLYYKYRIEATEKLFKSAKIEYVLISGDNSRERYDEPTDMKNDLIARGIPEDKIFLDYAGFRTLDSVVRAKKIFGQDQLTIISQPFHNERAIFISKRKGIESVGFNARDVSTRYGLRIILREKLARVKMLLDLTFGVQPKFLGEMIEIK